MSQKRNRRDCPAAGKSITSAECGAGRNSRYDCPLECLHNPYNAHNYDQLLAIEERVDGASVGQALKDPLAAPQVESVLRNHHGKALELTSSIVAALFIEVGDDGLTFGDRWAKAGFRGLRNDDRVLFESKQRTRALLLEVQTIVDENCVICINLLGDPLERLTFYDRSFAAMACRFQRVFALVYPTPGYWRLIGAIVELKDLGDIGTKQGFDMIVAHLGGDISDDWLSRNFVKVAHSILAVGRERCRLSLENTDFRLAQVDYELGEFEDRFAKRLAKAGCIEDEVEDEERDAGFSRAFIWPDTVSKDALTTSLGGTPYLGSVLLKPGMARLKASRSDLLSELRKAFEKTAGKKVRFVRELIEDIAAQKAKEVAGSDVALAPPELLKDVSGTQVSSSLVDLPQTEEGKALSIEECMNRYYRQLLDEPLPLLDGLTPNQAAQDFVARPKLVEWAKGLIRSTDLQNLQIGGSIDVNWLVKDLNLDEIDFPPPPKRAALEDPYIDESDEEIPEEDSEDSDELSFDWGDLIMDRMMDYDTAQMALDEMKAMKFDIVDDFFDLTAEIMDEDAYALFVSVLIMIWVAIVPKGMKVPYSRELCVRSIHETMENAELILEGFVSDDTEALDEFCLEPELFLFLAVRIDKIVKRLPRKQRPSKETIGGMYIAAFAAINTTIDTVEGRV